MLPASVLLSPGWRIRIHHANTTAADEVLDKLAASGTIAGWWPTLYESEIAAFGGPVGADIIHDLYCADTRGVLDYLRHPDPVLAARDLPHPPQRAPPSNLPRRL